MEVFRPEEDLKEIRMWSFVLIGTEESQQSQRPFVNDSTTLIVTDSSYFSSDV